MAITLWNPTTETFVMQFEGRTLILNAGQLMKVTESCGKFLLGGFGQRGLTSLEYGDDDEKIRNDALERNRAFRVKQVVDYNQRNEARKQMNLPYLNPPELIRQYARELGIDIIAPFTVRAEENARIQQLEDINTKLSTALEEERSERKKMSDQINALMKMMQPEKPSEELPPKKEAKGAK